MINPIDIGFHKDPSCQILRKCNCFEEGSESVGPRFVSLAGLEPISDIHVSATASVKI